MKRISPFIIVNLILLFCSACSKESAENSQGLLGWYTDLSSVAKTSDFDVINQAINNHELLSSYTYGGTTHEYYAEYDYFIHSDGSYHDDDANAGRLRFTIPNIINAYRIKDENTILFYAAWLYVDGRGPGDAVYKLYAGPIFGNMAYYDTPSYYTYVQSGSKLILSNGDIFTVTEEGLIKDGSSRILNKYDPSVIHN